MSQFWWVSDTGRIETSLNPAETRDFRAHAIEIAMYYVGSGEAIVISRGRNTILVDGGAGRGSRTLAGRLVGQIAPRSVRAIVASHPHQDHTNFHGVLSANRNLFAANAQYFDNATGPANRNWQRLSALPTPLPFRRAEITDRSPRRRDRISSFSNAGDAYLLRAITSATSDASRKYWSVFMFLRYREAWMLFTGDASQRYEELLLPDLEGISPRAHLLKVTHHGSSDGTSAELVSRLRPAISIVSTTNHASHWLEDDVERRLSMSEIYATYDRHQGVARDIIVRTDGYVWEEAGGGYEGLIFEVEMRAPALQPDTV